MKTYYKEYGVTASIEEKKDGTARLIIKSYNGKKARTAFTNRETPHMRLGEGFAVDDYRKELK